jgi:hypothetical protein
MEYDRSECERLWWVLRCGVVSLNELGEGRMEGWERADSNVRTNERSKRRTSTQTHSRRTHKILEPPHTGIKNPLLVRSLL